MTYFDALYKDRSIKCNYEENNYVYIKVSSIMEPVDAILTGSFPTEKGQCNKKCRRPQNTKMMFWENMTHRILIL